MTKVFEIRMAGFENKGAAMMLIAAAREVRASIPGAIVAVAPDHLSPYQSRARHGLWQRAEHIRGGVDLGNTLSLVPRNWRRRYGFITSNEVDVILDAAGLAYSDQWGPGHTQRLARKAIGWKKAGKKLVLLPQAFGPFNSPEIRTAIKTVADHADLIFARDTTSLKHLTEVVGERAHIRMAPDFTNLLAGEPTDVRLPGPSPVAIVPNARMLDKTDQNEAANYPIFLQTCAEILQASGHTPFFLVHEGAADLAIAQQVTSALATHSEILCPDDALEAKTMLGGCTAVISSRYHALISAMSQGTPAIGTGWNHKYKALFEDYGEPNALVSVTAPRQTIIEGLELITNHERRANYANMLQSSALRIKADARAVWQTCLEIS